MLKRWRMGEVIGFFGLDVESADPEHLWVLEMKLTKQTL